MGRIILGALLLSGCSGSGGDGGAGSTEGSSDGSTTAAMGTSTGLPPTGSSETSDTTGGSEESSTGSSSTGTPIGPQDGMMRVLSYNVAGLPEALSGSNPVVNTPLMSPLLNNFDLVLAQEDFSYHAELSADAEHPYQSTPGGGGGLGDGLNRFSQSAFENFERVGWIECNGTVDSGSDCLTQKGFSVARHELAPGTEVDVYNLHMDAGGSADDIAARQAQIQQILETISTRSIDRTIIVAGDTNMDEVDEADFVTLLERAGLTDACRELACGEEFRIDRIMFRNAGRVELTPTEWVVDLSFVDGEGGPLSDHEAVVVQFDWARR